MKCTRAPLPVGKNRIKKFQSVPELHGVQLCTPPLVYVIHIRPPFEGYDEYSEFFLLIRAVYSEMSNMTFITSTVSELFLLIRAVYTVKNA